MPMKRPTLIKPKQLTLHLFLAMADRHFIVGFDIYYNTEFNSTPKTSLHPNSNHTMWAI